MTDSNKSTITIEKFALLIGCPVSLVRTFKAKGYLCIFAQPNKHNSELILGASLVSLIKALLAERDTTLQKRKLDEIRTQREHARMLYEKSRLKTYSDIKP